jgi:hypothetical protein
VSAHLFVRAGMSSFREQVQIEFTQSRWQHAAPFPPAVP